MSAQLFPMLRNASLIALLAMPGVSYAEDILTVAANGKSESFSMDELLAMSQATVVTNNDYLDRSTTFTGPSLRGILDRFEVGRESDLTIAAINDFSVVIPAADAFDYEVILAILLDGERMPIREKGPIWLIYPMDEHEELSDDIYNGRLVWQLRSITAE